MLRKSARKEFDLSKQEQDPFLVMKMMVTTRECMKEIQEKLFAAQYELINNVDKTRNEEGGREDSGRTSYIK